MSDKIALIEWHEGRLAVGITRMDETHKEFIDIINRLGQAADEHFLTLFNYLIEHTHNHFQDEDIAMENSGFPPIFVHRNEHYRILDELKQLADNVEKGDFDAARAFICRYLPEWFCMHATTMDRALACHLKAAGMVEN